MKLYPFFFIALCCFTPEELQAQVSDSSGMKLRNTVYLDIATFVFGGNASINFEAPFGEHTLLRCGYGFGYLVQFDNGTVYSSGLLAMMNFVTSGNNSRFEGGIGGSFVQINRSTNIFLSAGSKLLPSFAIGYRYQPQTGGFVFRIGLGYTYAFGAPLYISLGSTI